MRAKFFSILILFTCLAGFTAECQQLPEIQLVYKSAVDIRVIYQKAEWQKIITELQTEINKEGERDAFIPLPKALKIDLIILDPQTYSNKTKAPPWVNPFFYKDKIYLRLNESNIDTVTIAQALKHEIVHAIINYWAGTAAPFWFDEGLAKWQQGELTNLDILNFREFYRQQGYISLEDLDLSFATMPKDKALAAYVQGALAIDLSTYDFWFGILKQLLTSVKNHTNFEQTLLSLTGLNYKAFNERLKKYIKSWLNQNRNLY